MTKGSFSTVENDPFETPRERKGCALDLPSPVFYEAATARAVQNTACSAWRGFRFDLLLAAAAALRWGLKASAFGDTAFLCEKAVRKRARGAHPLNPAIGSLTIGRLHALCKGVRAASCCGFRFGLLLAAAAALRRGYGLFLFRRSKRVCTAKEIVGRCAVNIRKLQ